MPHVTYNGTNFDIILKIVCWCVPCFPQKCSSLLSRFFPFSTVTAADCLRLLRVWYQVHRWKVWLVMCAQCKLCVCTRPTFLILKPMLIRNFPSGMLITSTALLYFSWTAIFSPNFNRLLGSSTVSLTLSPTFEHIFFSSFRSLSACSMIFSRNLRNLVCVKVYSSIFAFTCRDFQFPW